MKTQNVNVSPFPYALYIHDLSKAKANKNGPTDEYAAYRQNADVGDEIADQYIDSSETAAVKDAWRQHHKRMQGVPAQVPARIPMGDQGRRLRRDANNQLVSDARVTKDDPEAFRQKVQQDRAGAGPRPPQGMPQRAGAAGAAPVGGSSPQRSQTTSSSSETPTDWRGWEYFDPNNPNHIDETADWTNGSKQQHADAVPDLSKLTRTGTPGGGVSYRYDRDIPLGSFKVGIHKDENGKSYFVKQGLVKPPEEYTSRGKTPLPKSAGARNEWMLHRLVEIFKTDDNGIKPVPGTLHSEEKGGAPVPANYKWKFHNAGYMATPELIGNNGQHAVDFADLPWDEKRDRMRDLSKGMLVDAFLGSADLHDQNIMAVPGEEGIHRLDLGFYAGLSAFGDELPGFYDNGASKNYAFLPAIAYRFDEAARWRYHGDKNDDGTTMNPKQWRTKYAEDIIQQAKHMTSVWAKQRGQIEQILSQSHRYKAPGADHDEHTHPDKGGDIGTTLDGRMQAMQNMIDRYEGNPELLAHDLLKTASAMHGDPDRGDTRQRDEYAGKDKFPTGRTLSDNEKRFIGIPSGVYGQYTWINDIPGNNGGNRSGRTSDYDNDSNDDWNESDQETVEGTQTARKNKKNWPPFVRQFMTGDNYDNTSQAVQRKAQFAEGMKQVFGTKITPEQLRGLIKEHPQAILNIPKWLFHINFNDTNSQEQPTRTSSKDFDEPWAGRQKLGGKRFGIRNSRFGLTGLADLADFNAVAKLARGENDPPAEGGPPAFLAGQAIANILGRWMRAAERKKGALEAMPNTKEVLDRAREAAGSRGKEWPSDNDDAEMLAIRNRIFPSANPKYAALQDYLSRTDPRANRRNYGRGQDAMRTIDLPTYKDDESYEDIKDLPRLLAERKRQKLGQWLNQRYIPNRAAESPSAMRDRYLKRAERVGRAAARRDEFVRKWKEQIPDEYKEATRDPYGTAFRHKNLQYDRKDIEPYLSNYPFDFLGPDDKPRQKDEPFENIRDRYIGRRAAINRARQRKADWMRAAIDAGYRVRNLDEGRGQDWGATAGRRRRDAEVRDLKRNEVGRRRRGKWQLPDDYDDLQTYGTRDRRMNTRNWMTEGAQFVDNPDFGNPWGGGKQLMQLKDEKPEEWVARRRGRQEAVRGKRKEIINGLEKIIHGWDPSWTPWVSEWRKTGNPSGIRMEDSELPIANEFMNEDMHQKLLDMEKDNPQSGARYLLDRMGGANQFASHFVNGRRAGYGDHWKFDPEGFLNRMGILMDKFKADKLKKLARRQGVG